MTRRRAPRSGTGTGAGRSARGRRRPGPGPLVLLLCVVALAAAVAAITTPGWTTTVIAVAGAVAFSLVAAWQLGVASAGPSVAPLPDAEPDAPRTDLIAAVSHDLRTPLATIGAYVELLEAGDAGELSGEMRQMLDVVEENVQRAYALADDLVELRGVDTSAHEPVRLGDVVDRAVRALGPIAESRGLALRVESTLGEAQVVGNPVALDRVLVNLLSNAVKFTPEHGTITLRAGLEQGSAVVTVTDTGSGIPAEEQQRIFERYYRAGNARADRVPGSGLGLAIVRELVAQHGGTVQVTSQLGRGATFTLRLPALAAVA